MGACSSSRSKSIGGDVTESIGRFDFRDPLKKLFGSKQGDLVANYLDFGKSELQLLEGAGFCKSFGEYNVELLRPLKLAPKFSSMTGKEFKQMAIGYIKCTPPAAGADVGFIVFNVLGFWVGVAESTMDVIAGNFISVSWNVGASRGRARSPTLLSRTASRRRARVRLPRRQGSATWWRTSSSGR